MPAANKALCNSSVRPGGNWDQRAHSNRKLRFQGFCRSIRLIERVFWSFYSTVRSDIQYWLAFSWPCNLLSDKVLRITVYACANAPAGPRHRAVCRRGDSGPFFAVSSPVPAWEQKNSVAANTRLRHTDWHALWSSSYACAWCTPCRKGIRPLLNPLRGNIPLVGVHFRALLAPVTVFLHGAKSWQLLDLVAQGVHIGLHS